METLRLSCTSRNFFNPPGSKSYGMMLSPKTGFGWLSLVVKGNVSNWCGVVSNILRHLWPSSHRLNFSVHSSLSLTYSDETVFPFNLSVFPQQFLSWTPVWLVSCDLCSSGCVYGEWWCYDSLLRAASQTDHSPWVPGQNWKLKKKNSISFLGTVKQAPPGLTPSVSCPTLVLVKFSKRLS